MSFVLGNFSIDEIVMGYAEDFDGNLMYTLDQLSSASIEISSDSTDITDKNGNVVRTIYKSKTGTFSATNAFLHPQIMNVGSGAKINNAASVEGGITIPKMEIVAAGETVVLNKGSKDVIDDDSIQVIGIYGSGANGEVLATGDYTYDKTTKKITVPAAATEEETKAGTVKPVKYLVKYERQAATGYEIVNSANTFPETSHLTLVCSYVDPCDDNYKACYVYIPSFQASPETTINLSADDQEMDFSGTLQVDYCSADQALYYIWFPEEKLVKTAITADSQK